MLFSHVCNKETHITVKGSMAIVTFCRLRYAILYLGGCKIRGHFLTVEDHGVNLLLLQTRKLAPSSSTSREHYPDGFPKGGRSTVGA